MKRGRIFLILFLPFLISCVHSTVPPTAVNYSDKTVTFMIVDEAGGGYSVQGPLPKTTNLRSGKKIRWRFVNNTEQGIVDYVLIDGFVNTANGDTHPFGAGNNDNDQKFVHTNLNLEPAKDRTGKTTKPAKTITANTSEKYEYKITVKMESGEDVPYLDPFVIISN